MLECRLSLSFIADSNKIQRKATDTAHINYNNDNSNSKGNNSDYEYDRKSNTKRIKRNNHKRKQQEKWHIVQCITSVKKMPIVHIIQISRLFFPTYWISALSSTVFSNVNLLAQIVHAFTHIYCKFNTY